MKRKITSLLVLTSILIATPLTGCTNIAGNINSLNTNTQKTEIKKIAKKPKYVFLFIGDGMSYPQIQLANYYLNTSKNISKQKVNVEGKEKEILYSKDELTMLDFPISGSAQTYDSTSFAPDSASTATSIATGKKTWSGSINVNEDFTQKYETITEKLKEQKNTKIGIISSVNLNHATPAAFYAHQPSRSNYYDIGLELIESDFDYFAGGAFLQPTGKNKDKEDLYKLAENAGYTIIKSQQEAEKLNSQSGKTILIDDNLDDSDSMAYEIDRNPDEWALADYVEKGIEVLNNDNGFFMVIEGGKIDWASHANDAASTISETIALDNAIEKAVEFYNKYPEDTLILVTGDHETGGLTIGFAGTNYDTFLKNFENQKISYAKFDTDYVKQYKENKTDFNTVMKDITVLFGLKAPNNENTITQQKDSSDKHPTSNNTGSLVMTDYEYNLLKEAYEKTINRTGNEQEFAQDEYIRYGSYEPLTVTITHILNNKSGVNFGSYSHTGLPVEVLAKGVGSENFTGYYDNTDIYNKMAELLGIK